MPPSATRPALATRTNVYTNDTPSPWSASIKSKGKRPASEPEDRLKKRAKVSTEPDSSDYKNEIHDSSDSDSDVEMENIADVRARARRGTVFGMMNTASRSSSASRPGFCELTYT